MEYYLLVVVSYDYYRFEKALTISKNKEELIRSVESGKYHYLDVFEYDREVDPFLECEQQHIWLTTIPII